MAISMIILQVVMEVGMSKRGMVMDRDDSNPDESVPKQKQRM